MAESGPVVNQQPDIAAPNDATDDESWFEHKYIAATLDNHFWLIMAICLSIIVISIAVCVVIKKARGSRGIGYSKHGQFNQDSDYETEVEAERKPFNDF
eukprot:CAMPEP_0197023820 /NCGR_PEP_ID=MMETSP1384-20130603/4469_1 /TAXON_ID=29189 /ORGANISM="Ammonia sp." /LENGTH=98 /DNA_ID=CAMNT_0042452097 /DNA_START=69 /DNA_END=365 /DNA_ORIENTATION=-